jgi:hypothetical protein
MTARLDMDWDKHSVDADADVLPLVRHIAAPKPHLRCPECNSIIYTRRHKLCSICGESLPDAFLLSALEAARIRALLSAEKHRHRVWMRKAHWD